MKGKSTFFMVAFVVVVLTACATSRRQLALSGTPLAVDSVTTKSDTAVDRTLIIYYDRSIGKQALLNFVRIKQCKLIYNYVNFNVIAIRLAPQLDKKKTINELREMKGVLQVAEDRVLHLDEHRLD
ncbi:hypothetical protein KZO74_12490 [Prevotella salivae]|uniref:hypothetical protein n=1 Tax=Segatella salivae TaxID=228604 RepID=UPI001C5E350A|nr:hypothetical protein [Segatella salivae]MBW4765787.1 hypothetical protein [Segatella salivae]